MKFKLISIDSFIDSFHSFNKAQGQTLDRVEIHLPEPVFHHRQLYVTLSRARSYDIVEIGMRPKGRRTNNVVWKEVL